MFKSETLILRDADFRIIDTIEIEPGRDLTRGDVRVLLDIHKGAEVIERVTVIERRPS